MGKKKVAILLPWLKMGGTNKVALRFAKELSQYCNVTLILSQNTGELLSEVPENIHVIIDEMKDFRAMVKDDVKHFRIISFLCDAIYYAKIKLGKDSVDNYRYFVCRHDFVNDEEYDCAISYHGQSPERLLNLIYRIHAKKKAAWIHGEMSFSADKCRRMSKYYAMLDHFFFVSNHTKDSFARVIPFDQNKATVYYNPLDKTEILRKSEESFSPAFNSEKVNILTVGRISSEKGQDMIPAVMRQLLDNNYPVEWYVVGDGPNQETVENLITEYKVQDSVHLLGVKNNPYCYMKACDIYVQPSYTEGYSTTICEAGILGKTIVGTEPSGGIHDQITNGKDGLIVPATTDGLLHGIESLIIDATTRESFASEIQKKNFEGKGEIQKFLNYLAE